MLTELNSVFYCRNQTHELNSYILKVNFTFINIGHYITKNLLKNLDTISDKIICFDILVSTI